MNLNFKHYLNSVGEYGLVEEISYPVTSLTGLPRVSLGELILFENNSWGLVTSFSSDRTQVLLLATDPVNIGQRAVRTNQTITLSLNDNLKGKIINSLGTTITSSNQSQPHGRQSSLLPGRLEQRPIEHTLPNTAERSPVTRQIVTGLSVIDLLLPLSHGQRAVVVGDQQTGKMSFLLSAARYIAARQAVVIYAAIGKHWRDLSLIRNSLKTALQANQALIVSSHSHDTPGMIYLTPFTAITIAEYFRDQGLDTLVIFDDLSTHAKAYREISLLGRRFPGRESYPGDMFYTHARLLERAGSFSHPDQGNVGITALAVAETISTSFTPTIVSNLISITDGHLLFAPAIANQGRFPAIDFTLSISRVGHKTQPTVLKKLSNQIAVLLSEYQQTERYAHLSAELTSDIRDLLTTGSQLIAFLSQEAANHFSLPVQAVFAAMIWQKWFAASPREDIITWRNNFSNQYQSDARVRELLDPMINSPDLDTMLKTIKTNRRQLLRLCRATP